MLLFVFREYIVQETQRLLDTENQITKKYNSYSYFLEITVYFPQSYSVNYSKQNYMMSFLSHVRICTLDVAYVFFNRKRGYINLKLTECILKMFEMYFVSNRALSSFSFSMWCHLFVEISITRYLKTRSCVGLFISAEGLKKVNPLEVSRRI